MFVKHGRNRASVVECGGKPWRDTAVFCRTAIFGLTTFFPRSTAVSPGQEACALPLCHRTPRRCRERREGQMAGTAAI